ncbi:hypothetical protein SAE02_72690 [Skermanella aerolata]|uniref:Uncharacterized protein n=1 Tax=Skermanella aerolata TaxID=393310 RepID=A0A512E319_9PROT|nr:hypothetical protein [Skermanella aerolata]KJB90259.1 hypothetical protein N826_38800 [Skermanella aerolata KACC 11604]GEO43121.1 hypothetical protein SAE02_72690 [Skermanella aerolata]
MRLIDQQPIFDLDAWDSYRSDEAAIRAAEIGAGATIRAAEMAAEASREAMNLGYKAALLAASMTIVAAVIAYVAAMASVRRQTKLETARHKAAVSGYRRMQFGVLADYRKSLDKFGASIRLEMFDEPHVKTLDLTEFSMAYLEAIEIPSAWLTSEWREHTLLGEEFADLLEEARHAMHDLNKKLRTYRRAFFTEETDTTAARAFLPLMIQDNEVYNFHGLPQHEYRKVYDQSIYDAWRSAEGALDRLAGILKPIPGGFSRIFR